MTTDNFDRRDAIINKSIHIKGLVKEMTVIIQSTNSSKFTDSMGRLLLHKLREINLCCDEVIRNA